MKYIRSWLESLETDTPDMSCVHKSQCDLILQANSDQEQIGWHLAMHGYISTYWKLTVSATPHLEEDNKKGDDWI
jgi:hypothetical protein